MRSETRKLIEKLEEVRKSTIVCMIYSKYAEMSREDAEIVFDVLSRTLEDGNEKVKRLELILDSIGGDAGAAFKIVRVLRRFCEEFNVIVPEKAKSAATLVALGSDKIYMTRLAELGPIDPIVSHPLMTGVMIPARAVQVFIDYVLPTILKRYGEVVADYFLKIDYNHVGFCRVSMEESEYYARALLETYHLKGKKREEIDAIVKSLTRYPSHDFMIDYELAREQLKLNVELLPVEEEKLVWQLYRTYRQQLNDVVLIVESRAHRRDIKRPKVTIW